MYQCELCGQIVEVIHGGAGELVCCNQPMQLLDEKTADQGKEKHVPVVEKTSEGIKVKVGDVPHPMEDKHYIEWIEVEADGQTHAAFLTPGDAPEATFKLKADKVTAREHCTVHGLWKGEGK